MPPKVSKKRASTDNTTSNAKRKKSSAQDESNGTPPPGPVEAGAPAKEDKYEYVCVPARNLNQFDSDDEDGDETLDKNFEENKDKYGKPAADFPEWKWVMMHGMHRRLDDNQQQCMYRDPDNFDMHIFQDFYGYGIVEILEQQMLSFDKVVKSKNVNDMWLAVSCLGHFLNYEIFFPWEHVDDGERVVGLHSLMGIAFLTTLDAIANEKQLTSDSRFLDLALIMALYLRWDDGQGDFEDDKLGYSWQRQVVLYAKEAKIDLLDSLVPETDEVLEKVGSDKSFKYKSGPDRWKWKTAFSKYCKTHSVEVVPPSESTYVIPAWSRTERAKFAFDKKDPLADVPAKVLKDIKAGKLELKF